METVFLSLLNRSMAAGWLILAGRHFAPSAEKGPAMDNGGALGAGGGAAHLSVLL